MDQPSGPTVAGLAIADRPERWAGLGFTVAPDKSIRVGAVVLRLGAAGPRGIVGWTLTGAGDRDVAGIPTAYGAPPRGPAPVHRNGAISVDHVVLVAPDMDDAFASLAAAGMRLRRERALGGGRRQGFFRHGEAIVEVVGPSGEAAARLWGLTITVADLDACAKLLGDRLGDTHDAVQPGRQIATVSPAAGLTVPVAFMSPQAGSPT